MPVSMQPTRPIMLAVRAACLSSWLTMRASCARPLVGLAGVHAGAVWREGPAEEGDVHPQQGLQERVPGTRPRPGPWGHAAADACMHAFQRTSVTARGCSRNSCRTRCSHHACSWRLHAVSAIQPLIQEPTAHAIPCIATFQPHACWQPGLAVAVSFACMLRCICIAMPHEPASLCRTLLPMRRAMRCRCSGGAAQRRA